MQYRTIQACRHNIPDFSMSVTLEENIENIENYFEKKYRIFYSENCPSP